MSTASVLCLFLFFASLGQLVNEAKVRGISINDAIPDNPWAIFLTVYGAVAGVYPLALVTYHLFLMGRGETTREYLNSHNFLPKDRHRPFDHGKWFTNVRNVLLRGHPETYLPFTASYVEGDPQFGAQRDTKGSLRASEQQAGSVEMQNVAGNGPSFMGPSTRKN